MILLELFSGNGDISKSFVKHGGKAYRVDWSPNVEADLYKDVSKLTVLDVVGLCGGVPDVIWASPQCTTYSIATHRHRTLKEGLEPKTELARYDDAVNEALWDLIDYFMNHGTRYYFVENPRGRMRHMSFVKDRPRYTLAYCMYGRTDKNGKYTMKPTDIWTNYPNPEFRYCDHSHVHSSQSVDVGRGYLDRGRMPTALTDHIASLLLS